MQQRGSSLKQHMYFNPPWGEMQRLTHILESEHGINLSNLGLRHPVGSHAVVALTVAACGPHKQRCGHHVQRRRHEGQVQGPAQTAVHLIGKHGHPVEQVHSCQVAAHCGEGAQTYGAQDRRWRQKSYSAANAFPKQAGFKFDQVRGVKTLMLKGTKRSRVKAWIKLKNL